MSRSYRITASEPLFNEWDSLCQELQRMNTLIQNDGVEVTLADLMEWHRDYLRRVESLGALRLQIMKHIVGQEQA